MTAITVESRETRVGYLKDGQLFVLGIDVYKRVMDGSVGTGYVGCQLLGFLKDGTICPTIEFGETRIRSDISVVSLIFKRKEDTQKTVNWVD